MLAPTRACKFLAELGSYVKKPKNCFIRIISHPFHERISTKLRRVVWRSLLFSPPSVESGPSGDVSGGKYPPVAVSRPPAAGLGASVPLHRPVRPGAETGRSVHGHAGLPVRTDGRDCRYRRQSASWRISSPAGGRRQPIFR